jgi:hypothetical protein
MITDEFEQPWDRRTVTGLDGRPYSVGNQGANERLWTDKEVASFYGLGGTLTDEQQPVEDKCADCVLRRAHLEFLKIAGCGNETRPIDA